MVYTLPSLPLGRRAPARAALLAIALALAGCASTPPPDGAMFEAQSLIQQARDADAADYAPVDLNAAQDRFQQAQAALADHKYDKAADFAAEASADANLARVKAQLGAARAQIQSKSAVNQQLRDNMDIDHPLNPPGAPASAGTMPAPPTTELAPMPAPSATVLGAPDGGFQTMPANGAAPAGASSSGMPASGDGDQGGSP